MYAVIIKLKMLFNFFNCFYNDAVIAGDVNTMLRMERLLANVQADRQWREEREQAAAKGNQGAAPANLPIPESI